MGHGQLNNDVAPLTQPQVLPVQLDGTECSPKQSIAHDSGLCSGAGRSGMAKLVIQLTTKSDVQSVRSGPFRTNVQSFGPEFVLTS